MRICGSVAATAIQRIRLCCSLGQSRISNAPTSGTNVIMVSRWSISVASISPAFPISLAQTLNMVRTSRMSITAARIAYR